MGAWQPIKCPNAKRCKAARLTQNDWNMFAVCIYKLNGRYLSVFANLRVTAVSPTQIVTAWPCSNGRGDLKWSPTGWGCCTLNHWWLVTITTCSPTANKFSAIKLLQEGCHPTFTHVWLSHKTDIIICSVLDFLNIFLNTLIKFLHWVARMGS